MCVCVCVSDQSRQVARDGERSGDKIKRKNSPPILQFITPSSTDFSPHPSTTTTTKQPQFTPQKKNEHKTPFCSHQERAEDGTNFKKKEKKTVSNKSFLEDTLILFISKIKQKKVRKKKRNRR